jgi:hypothetical protein
VASAIRSAPIVLETQTGEVPEPSVSRYWCISKKVVSSINCSGNGDKGGLTDGRIIEGI